MSSGVQALASPAPWRSRSESRLDQSRDAGGHRHAARAHRGPAERSCVGVGSQLAVSGLPPFGAPAGCGYGVTDPRARMEPIPHHAGSLARASTTKALLPLWPGVVAGATPTAASTARTAPPNGTRECPPPSIGSA